MSKWSSRTSPFIPPFRLCLTERAFNKELKRLKVGRGSIGEWANKNGARAHYISYGGKVCFMVCMCKKEAGKRKLVEVAGLLVHEAMHLWRWIREDINEMQPSAEFEAYYMQCIAQELIHSYLTQTGRIKKRT